MLKGLANVLLTLAFFYVCGWWVFVGAPDRKRQREDPVYASELFHGLAPVQEVLASRKWHRKDAEPWDCTYAIVRLTPDAPLVPPVRVRDNDLGWRYVFGGNWIPTPAPKLGDTTRDAIGFCAQYWPNDLTAEITQIIANPGAWYDRDRVGETVYLYAPKSRLAARIRFGD